MSQDAGTASWATGYATSFDGLLVADKLRALVADPDRLACVGGAFALMRSSAGALQLISDRHGAVPIYYAHDGRSWVAADEYGELLSRIAARTPDARAGAEMLAFKYALEDRTLLVEIKEVPPATIVTLSDRGVSQERYWSHDIRPSMGRRGASMVAELNGVLDRVAHRAAAVADLVGLRRWGVNLTGGRDSRLIALAASKRDRTVCFTTSASAENRAASDVAHVLGLPHVMLQPWIDSPRADGGAIADALSPTAMYHVAGHPLALQAAKPWPVDGFLSGHLGDMYAGSHLSLRTIEAADAGSRRLEQYFVNHHAAIPPELLRRLLRRRHAELADAPYETMRGLLREAQASSPLGAVLQVDLEQRQRRLILRDYVALRTLGPTLLWFADHEWVDFWRSVPFEWQVGTPLLERAVRDRLRTGAPGLDRIPANGVRLRTTRFPRSRARIDDVARRARRKARSIRRSQPAGADRIPPARRVTRDVIENVEWLCEPDALRGEDLPASVVYIVESLAHASRSFGATTASA